MAKPELSIAIPFYNEEQNAPITLKELPEYLENKKVNYEIIAVNNGSKDKTEQIIDKFCKKNKRIKKINVPVNKGYGYGIIQGLKKCSGKYIGYTDGDNQISNSKIYQCYQTLAKENLDLCKLRRKERGEGAIRKIYSFFFNNLIKLLFHVDAKDINAVPKIMKKEVYKTLNLNSKDWFIDAEILIKSKIKNYKSKELLAISEKRKSGKSYVKFSTTIEFLKNIIKYKTGAYK